MLEAANPGFNWLPTIDPPRVFIPLGAAKVSAGFPSPAAILDASPPYLCIYSILLG
jgi:hypothetical protein